MQNVYEPEGYGVTILQAEGCVTILLAVDLKATQQSLHDVALATRVRD